MTWEPDGIAGVRLDVVLGGLVAALIVALVACQVTRPAVEQHRCQAPCSVVFDPGVEEDEVGWDYGWLDKSRAVVGVHRAAPR